VATAASPRLGASSVAFGAMAFFCSSEILRWAQLREPGNMARSLKDGRARMPTKRGEVLKMTALEFLYSCFHPRMSAGSLGSVVQSATNKNLKRSVPNFFPFLLCLTKVCVQRGTPIVFPWRTTKQPHGPCQSVQTEANLTILIIIVIKSTFPCILLESTICSSSWIIGPASP
jgi:hypothetical protein